MTERLPDRLRDRLYFGMARLRERMEIADAVNRGRAVTDPRLAAQAVEAARRRQKPRIGLIAIVTLVGTGDLVWGIVERDWVLLALAPLWAAMLARGFPRGQKNAARAEQENRRLLA